MNKTLNYYDEFAQSFFEKTVGIDMQLFYDSFEQYLLKGSTILDFGCGSGRDSKYFLDRGYRVTSIDGSPKMCELASKYIVNDVQCKRFDEIDYEHEFDGIWASASLLHIPKKNLKSTFKMLYKALKDNGYMYVSFKYGKYEGEVDGRYFTYLEYSDLRELVNEDFEILVEMETEDLRLESCNSKWVNVILKKVVKN